MKKTRIGLVCFIVICGIAMLTPDTVYAMDVAPPDWTPGANPEPGAETTQVRMEAETVILDIQPRPRTERHPAWTKVSAEFTLRNLGTTAEKMAVRFPLTTLGGDGFGGFPEISDLTATVNGKTVKVLRKTETYTDSSNHTTEIAWGAFEVTFPPGEAVNLKVNYTLEGVGYYPTVEFKYLLQTGAGWKDTIGTVDLYVRLPYDVSSENVVYYDLGYWTSTTGGGVSSGNEIHWHYEELEPDESSDLLVTITAPQAWQKVLKARSETQRNNRDGEAWGQLGKALKEAAWAKRGFRSDPGGQQMVREAMQAYDQAVTLLPQDSLWHFGYADLLYNHYIYDYYWYPDIDDPSLLVKALEELQISLELSPHEPRALELAEWIAMDLNNTIDTDRTPFVFLALTTTPTRQFTSTPVIEETTPVPDQPAPSATPRAAKKTATPIIQAKSIDPTSTPLEPTPARSPAGSGGLQLPFCGSILITLFAVLGRIFFKAL